MPPRKRIFLFFSRAPTIYFFFSSLQSWNAAAAFLVRARIHSKEREYAIVIVVFPHGAALLTVYQAAPWANFFIFLIKNETEAAALRNQQPQEKKKSWKWQHYHRYIYIQYIIYIYVCIHRSSCAGHCTINFKSSNTSNTRPQKISARRWWWYIEKIKEKLSAGSWGETRGKKNASVEQTDILALAIESWRKQAKVSLPAKSSYWDIRVESDHVYAVL